MYAVKTSNFPLYVKILHLMAKRIRTESRYINVTYNTPGLYPVKGIVGVQDTWPHTISPPWRGQRFHLKTRLHSR